MFNEFYPLWLVGTSSLQPFVISKISVQFVAPGWWFTATPFKKTLEQVLNISDVQHLKTVNLYILFSFFSCLHRGVIQYQLIHPGQK